MTEGKTIRAKCRACEHVWIVAYLPMDLGMAACLMQRAACPKCGDARPFLAGEEEPIDV